MRVALKSHYDRNPSSGIFPKLTGDATQKNLQAENFLRDLLTNPNAKRTIRHHAKLGEILEIKVPGGAGVRFSSNGKTFIGWIE